jgi:hypothetical protein
MSMLVIHKCINVDTQSTFAFSPGTVSWFLLELTV